MYSKKKKHILNVVIWLIVSIIAEHELLKFFIAKLAILVQVISLEHSLDTEYLVIRVHTFFVWLIKHVTTLP